MELILNVEDISLPKFQGNDVPGVYSVTGMIEIPDLTPITGIASGHVGDE